MDMGTWNFHTPSLQVRIKAAAAVSNVALIVFVVTSLWVGNRWDNFLEIVHNKGSIDGGWGVLAFLLLGTAIVLTAIWTNDYAIKLRSDLEEKLKEMDHNSIRSKLRRLRNRVRNG